MFCALLFYLPLLSCKNEEGFVLIRPLSFLLSHPTLANTAFGELSVPGLMDTIVGPTFQIIFDTDGISIVLLQHQCDSAGHPHYGTYNLFSLTGELIDFPMMISFLIAYPNIIEEK